MHYTSYRKLDGMAAMNGWSAIHGRYYRQENARSIFDVMEMPLVEWAREN